jgi:hypothetical protein
MKDHQRILKSCTTKLATVERSVFEKASSPIPPNRLMEDPFEKYFEGLEDMITQHVPNVVLTY